LKPFDRFVSFGFNEYSLFGSYSFYKKVIKVRVRLEKFTYCKVVPRRNYTEIQVLVTNWIDVTGNDFDAAMQNQLRKGFISR
jgi:hypothetical protein